MITAYTQSDSRLTKVPFGGLADHQVLWFDLNQPTPEEEASLESRLKIEIPTREEMGEIEVSSRLYTEDNAVFMIGVLPSKTDSDEPEIGPVTFILTNGLLVTVRYHEPKAFTTFPARAEKAPMGCVDGETVFAALMEAIIDRLADVLERLSRDVEATSRIVFQQAGTKRLQGRDFHDILIKIGRKGEILSHIRDSLLTIERMLGFLVQTGVIRTREGDLRQWLKTLAKDAKSLTDHAVFLSQKMNFLLDATLGMVNIEQNKIIKIFSVAAVIFLPPTLIASIYGMNFDVMPELKWAMGYPFAIILMIASAVLAVWYFKRNDWL